MRIIEVDIPNHPLMYRPTISFTFLSTPDVTVGGHRDPRRSSRDIRPTILSGVAIGEAGGEGSREQTLAATEEEGLVAGVFGAGEVRCWSGIVSE